MKKLIFILPALNLLTSCAEPLTQEEQIAAHTKTCEAFGFKLGTNEMARCVMQQVQADSAARQQRSEALARAGQILSNADQPQQPPLSTGVRTTCAQIGNNLVCDSY